eukprot:1157496-Pelagomonas_calceolata.AAC.1
MAEGEKQGAVLPWCMLQVSKPIIAKPSNELGNQDVGGNSVRKHPTYARKKLAKETCVDQGLAYSPKRSVHLSFTYKEKSRGD